MAEPAAVLLVVFNLTLAISTADRALSQAPRAQPGAEVWTDEALGQLPENSLVLVRSQPIAWRLWAAKLVRGQRPDVLVVPLPLLSQGNVASALLDAEPALGPLISDVSITGAPREYSLSTLADSRPLYVELERDWDARLLEHLRPQPLWLSFAPHALGRSDRTEALEESRRAFRRVMRAARREGQRDTATLTVLGARASEQAVALAALGDRDNVRKVLFDLRSIDAELPLIARLSQRLSERGRPSVRELLE